MKKKYNLKAFLNSDKKLRTGFCLLLLWALAAPLKHYAQQIYTFTPCGATGQSGPSQTQVNFAYLSTNLNLSVTATAGIQTFTIPHTGNYRIEADGAQGGSSSTFAGGLGARMIGDFSFSAGTVLKILVGQTGINGLAIFNGDVEQSGGTGGGGSFVSTLGNTPLIIAGGGGGGSQSGTGGGVNATGANGTVGINGIDGGGASGSGGISGAGGLTYNWSGWHGGTGGGGFSGNGVNNSAGNTVSFGTVNGPGISFLNGGAGGTGGSSGRNGGFGGGGSSGFTGAGGGGYSGGGAANSSTSIGGGGGGSYNSGINQNNTNGINSGDGKVIITELCYISLTASGPNASSPSICSGGSVTLTTSAVSNYTWSTNNTTTTSIVVSPTSSQTYSVIGTSSANCVASASITVIVSLGLPVLTITNTPNTICLGKTATLTAGGALSYTWAGGPGGVINGQTFTPTATSNYTVTGQNGCGTTTSVTTITIAPLVVNATAASTLICSGSTTTLTATSAVSGYTWYPVAIPAISVVVVPTVNTVYTVVASDGTCAGVAMVTVTTKPNPTLSIAVSSPTVCAGAIITMTASGALTYTWTSPSSNAPNISDVPTIPTLYQVSGTNSVNCISSVSQLVLPQASPTIVISANKTFVCSGDPVTLTASGATSYNWTNGPPTAVNLVNPTSNTIYTVTGTTAPCSSSLAITINVLTASVAASVATPSICNGASASLHASGANSYVWVGLTSFNGNVTVTPSVTTIYVVNATTTATGLSCPSSTNITVTVFNNPTVTIVATKTIVCKSDPNIILTAGGATTYTWSTSAGSISISVHPQSTTTYSITGVDANGCVNTASLLVKVNVCNGIAELTDKKNNISIYPNPSNGEFVVSSGSDINLELINELGQEIKTMSLTDQNDHKISVTNLASGVYFIVGQNSTDKISQKIIVAK